MRLRGGVTVQPNLIDRLVEYVDPERARNRLQARVQLAIAAAAIGGHWPGGRTDRRATKDWNPPAGSADEDNRWDLPVLRTRSRDLQRRNPMGLGAINTNVTSIVGTGLALHARPDVDALGLTPEAAQTWRTTTQREFRLWAEHALECDQEATLDFYAQQALALRSCLESGDVFALLPMEQRRFTTYKLKISLIEADRVCNKDHGADTLTLVEGVQRTEGGMPVAYHIARFHPGDVTTSRGKREWYIVPAFGTKTGRRNVIHLYDKRRPGLTRGTPYLAPVIEILKRIGDYTDAELAAAVVASLFTVFVKSESGEGLNLNDAGVAPSTTQTSGSDIKLGQGAIIDLAGGEDVTFANPNRPNAAADVFMQAMMRQLGVALELPYEVLVKHFTASYSAARSALLEAWRFFKCRRVWLAGMFCQPIYEAWLDEAVSLGRVIAPGYFDDPALRMAWAGAEWIGDAPGQIDPEKEINAAAKRIETRVSNRTIETMQLHGMDWLDVNEQLEREEKAIGARGVASSASNARAAAPVDDEPEKPDEPDQETEEDE